MFCPQCGQQQVTGHSRFCSRCGFPLDGVVQLLTNGGLLPVYRNQDEPAPISARRKGVKQGGLLLLSGALVVPILAQGGWRRPNTAELANPPSITENTTRLLDKE